MDDRVKSLNTPEKCEIFGKNARERGRPDLALEANQRAIELRAEEHEAETPAERESLQAVFAYEESTYKKNGKRTRASRTWQLIKRHGIIEAIERTVKRDPEPEGYALLVELGLEQHAYEAVILRHPEVFSEEAQSISQERLKEWSAVGG
jgi:hypothetical protein